MNRNLGKGETSTQTTNVWIPAVTWRIIPGLVSGEYPWLISPLSRVVPLPNGHS